MTLWENSVLSGLTRMRLALAGFIRVAGATRFSEAIVAAFDVRTAGVGHAARSLSGGNLQKFVVGREIMQKPAVLIASQPTWGVDANAAVTIHQALLDLARSGAAILVISQDLDELMAISTRVAVIAGGRLSEPRPVAKVTAEELGRAMGGRSLAEGMGLANA
jgi:simple sugar transport system ATP-binding protein